MGSSCCTTREKPQINDVASKDNGKGGTNGQPLNEVQKSLFYISRFLDESNQKSHKMLLDRDSQMIVLCFLKDQLKNFIIGLSQLITIIKTKTGQIFIPTAIQNSPISPDTEMIIIMRSIEKIDKFSIDRDAILDESKLARSFTIRTFQFITGHLNERKAQLKNDLKNFYKNEGLMIVGGIQDQGKVNNMQLLFYKTDNHRLGSKGETSSYDVLVDARPKETNDKDFEIILNQAQVDQNASIRTIITFEDTYDRYHFLVEQIYDADRLYMINEYPVNLNESYSRIMKEPGTPGGSPNDFAFRQSVSEKLSKEMNILEKRNANTVVDCITNTTLGDSYIIFSQ